MNEPGSKGKWLKGWSGGAVEGGRGWRPIERKIMCIFVHATCPKGTARHLTQPIQGGINKWFHKGTHNKRLRKSECQSSEMKRNEVKWNENPRKGHENIIVGDTQHTYTHTHADQLRRPKVKETIWTDSELLETQRACWGMCGLKIKSKTRLCHMGARDIVILRYRYITEPRRLP